MNNKLKDEVTLSSRKIIFLTTSLSLAGAQTQLVQLAIALKKRGLCVKIVSMLSLQSVFPELNEYGIPTYSLDMQRGKIDFSALFRLVKILRRDHFDILHCHMVHANLLGRIVRLFVPIPVVVSTAHNIYEGGWERNLWYRLTDFLCDMTTQVSNVGLKRYIELKMVNPKKAMFIPNGVNMEVFKRNTDIGNRERVILDIAHCFVWLAVGRLDKAKDYPNMINAFAIFCRNVSNSVLLIAGDGDLRSDIEMLVKKLDIMDKVRFLGLRQDIPNLMSAADAYVMSSAWEGMPCVLLEALACELPVVTTEVGGIREIIKEGETGFLVEPGHPERLASVMMEVAKLPVEKRLEMGQAGRRYVKEAYNLENIVDEWEELYLKLILKNEKSSFYL